MDVKRLYEEKMKKFFDLSNSTRDTVYLVFPPSKEATIDDLYQIRKLVDKMEISHKYASELLRVKNLTVNGKKLLAVRQD